MPEKDKGYDISIQKTGQILRLQLWGLWDLELGKQFSEDFQKRVIDMSATAKEWHILADIIRFAPQFPEVQQFLSEGMHFAKSHGMKKAARIVDNTITKLQIERLSKASDLPAHAFFTSEVDAMNWLSG